MLIEQKHSTPRFLGWALLSFILVGFMGPFGVILLTMAVLLTLNYRDRTKTLAKHFWGGIILGSGLGIMLAFIMVPIFIGVMFGAMHHW